MINETNIRCFLALAETLNFSETAKKLFISQQAVSKHIAQLEKDFGFRLFNRTHHYVQLTKAGENCYKIFSEFRDIYEKTIEENRKLSQELSKALHIGYLELLDLLRYLAQSIRQLKLEVPGIRYLAERYNRLELNEKFLNRELDMIITYQSFAPAVSGLKETVLFNSELLLLVSKNYPLVTEQADYLTFKHEPLIYVSFGNLYEAEMKKKTLKDLHQLGLYPAEIKTVPNMETAYTAVELGAGFIISTGVSKAANNENLQKYPLGKTENIVCVYHDDEDNPLVKKYLQLLLDSIPRLNL